LRREIEMERGGIREIEMERRKMEKGGGREGGGQAEGGRGKGEGRGKGKRGKGEGGSVSYPFSSANLAFVKSLKAVRWS
jgi:hypothetical protein